MSNQKLETILDDDFAGLDFLVQLNLTKTSLNLVEDKVFFHTKSVETLDLSHNNLQTLDLHKLRNLQKLDLSYNSFKLLPSFTEESGIFIPLGWLDLSNNPFSNIIAGHLPDSIKYLDLSCMKTTAFSADALDNQFNLEELIIRGYDCDRKLKVIDRGAFLKSNKLRKLDLSGNQIVAIPGNPPVNLIFV